MLALSSRVPAQDNVTIGQRETIHSNILNEDRTVIIYSPTFTSRGGGPARRYPVLYLLDGEAHFYSTVGIIQQLSQSNGNGILPEMIVVAIESPDRMSDLTPSDSLHQLNPFFEFISTELVPAIEKKFPTAPYRLLVGHSLGGLMAVDVMARKPELFNACIAIDPSMWYGKETYLNNVMKKLPKLRLANKRLFIGIANTMPRGMTAAQLKTDRSEETKHIRSIFKLDAFLQKNGSGLHYASKYYGNDTHQSVPLISEYDGLHFIFDYYPFDAQEKDFYDSTAVMAVKLKRHFAKVSEMMGYPHPGPADFVNYVATYALDNRHYQKAEAFLKLNMEWYPGDPGVYEAYADYWIARGDTNHAIANYKRSLEIKNTEIAQKKLDALTNPALATIQTSGLENYAGVYNLETYNIPILLEIRGNALWAKVAGSEDQEFLVLSKDVFTVKGKTGYRITFEMEAGKPKGFTSVQPNGTFRAVFVKR